MKKIYDLEYEFLSTFDVAVGTIQCNELTLRQVISFGFNNLYVYDENGCVVSGYEEEDFNENLLNSIVRLIDWDYDEDGYRILKLEIRN